MSDIRKLIEALDRIAEDNPVDTVTVDVPLLIRLLEFAREDAKTDMDLHQLTQKLISKSASGETLTMDSYKDLVAGLPVDDTGDEPAERSWRERYGRNDETPADED